MSKGIFILLENKHRTHIQWRVNYSPSPQYSWYILPPPLWTASCIAWTCRASHNTPLWPLWPSGWWSAASTPPHLSASSRSPGPPPCKLSSQHRAKAHPEQKLLKVDNFVLTAYLRLFLGAKINASMLKTLSVRIEVRRKTKSPSALLSSQTSPTSIL